MKTQFYGKHFIFKQCIHIGAMETCHLGMFIIIPSIFSYQVFTKYLKIDKGLRKDKYRMSITALIALL